MATKKGDGNKIKNSVECTFLPDTNLRTMESQRTTQISHAVTEPSKQQVNKIINVIVLITQIHIQSSCHLELKTVYLVFVNLGEFFLTFLLTPSINVCDY